MSNTHIEPVPEADSHDADSALGDGDSIASVTTSLATSIYQFREEFGRTFHSFREGQYRFPNDEAELDRLDLQHHLFTLMIEGALATAPLPKSIQNVLDVGTGTGIWAIEFAEMHPEAHVIGTDLSPTQPTHVPPNCEFQIDDANDTWTFNRKFDYIHVREMQMAIKEEKLFKQSFDILKPGGWFEIMGTALPLRCDDGTTKGTAFEQWCDDILEISKTIGMPFDNPYHYREWLETAGFVNVQERRIPLPINSWPKDKRMKQIGAWEMVNFASGLEGFSLKLFQDVLGWKLEELKVFLAQVRKDIENRKIHGYVYVMCLCAQKPTAK